MSNSSYLIIFSVIFFFTSTLAKAQLLWEISGNKLTQKSYLFGTVHVGDERVIDYASNVYPYMDNSLTVAGELDLNFMTSILAIGYVMSPRDSTLSKLLTKSNIRKPILLRNCSPKTRPKVTKFCFRKPIFLPISSTATRNLCPKVCSQG